MQNNQEFDELKEKYLRLKVGVDVPLSPGSLAYPHTTGGAPISLPDYQLIKRSIVAMEIVGDKELTMLHKEHAQLKEDYEFVAKLMESPMLGKEELNVIAKRKELLDNRSASLESRVKNEVIHFAFTKLLYFAEINSEIRPNTLYHYYAHASDRLVLSLIGPHEQSPYNNYVGSVRREDDDKLHVIKVADKYKERVLGSGKEKSSNL